MTQPARVNRVWSVAVTVMLTGVVWHAAAARPERPGWSQAALSQLSDQEFWALVSDVSEPGGTFHADNFTSNEPNFAVAAGLLAKSGPHGGAYLGVGPEQNFHYIAAIRPAIGIVFDIRRQAVVQHLLYKAIFELSSSREEFIARLFSVPVPERRDPKAPPDVLWQRFTIAPGVDRARFAANLADVKTHLTRTHGFALSAEDLNALESVYDAFFRFGPAIDYASGGKGLTTGNTNFVQLTSAVDADGVPRSFLAGEEPYQFIRSLQRRNLIVPIQADFGGPSAIRAVGEFLRAKGLSVSVFYLSNVEQYLFNPRSPTAPGGQETNGGWRAFYDNLAALPADDSSVLLRVPLGSSKTVVRRILPDGTVGLVQSEAAQFCPLREFLAAVRAGKITSHGQATACGR